MLVPSAITPCFKAQQTPGHKSNDNAAELPFFISFDHTFGPTLLQGAGGSKKGKKVLSSWFDTREGSRLNFG